VAYLSHVEEYSELDLKVRTMRAAMTFHVDPQRFLDVDCAEVQRRLHCVLQLLDMVKAGCAHMA
jgi:hypothetical protein